MTTNATDPTPGDPCPHCRVVLCFGGDGRTECPYCGAFWRVYPDASQPLVSRGQLWGDPIPTYATEAELNGYRASQGRML